MKKCFVGLLFLVASICLAQTAPQYEVNLNYLTGGPYGQNSALDTSFGYQFTTNNTLQADFITMPGPSYTGFFGGDNYNLCAIKAIEDALAITALPCGKFGPFLNAEAGLGRLTPATGPDQQGFSALFAAGAGYDPTGQGKYTLLFKGGFGRFGPTMANTKLSGNGFFFYSGISFGGGTSPAASQAKLARMQYAQAKKQKRLQEKAAKAEKRAAKALSN